jgi:hypothetical protein
VRNNIIGFGQEAVSELGQVNLLGYRRGGVPVSARRPSWVPYTCIVRLRDWFRSRWKAPICDGLWK